MTTRDAIAGAMYGLALGDALGRPTEFMQLPEIWRRFGREGHLNLPEPALFTDDTQMTLAVARALGAAEAVRPAELACALGAEFVRWAREDEPRAPGMTCLRAVRELAKGTRWEDATVAGSKGCGANMRTASTAFLRHSDDAVGASQLQAALTHGHPTALAATELTALAIRWATDTSDLRELPSRLLAHAEWRIRGSAYNHAWLGELAERRWSAEGWTEETTLGWVESAQRVELAQEFALAQGVPQDVCREVGDGWTAETALGTALYFAVRYRHDPVLAISEAARTSGDSDSIASIAGAIVGARHGIEGWPSGWRRVIERRTEIEEAIEVTYRLS